MLDLIKVISHRQAEDFNSHGLSLYRNKRTKKPCKLITANSHLSTQTLITSQIPIQIISCFESVLLYFDSYKNMLSKQKQSISLFGKKLENAQLFNHRATIQKQPLVDTLHNRRYCKFRKIHRKTPVPKKDFLIGLARNFVKKRLRHRCFPVNFFEIRTPPDDCFFVQH